MLHLKFRTKLFAIAGVAILAFTTLFGVTSVLGSRLSDRLRVIELSYVPRLSLGPTLEAHFDQLHRALQDAAAAQDMDALNATRARERQLLAELDAARPSLDSSTAPELRAALEEYFDAAFDVSRKLIAEDTGEDFASFVAGMRQKHTHALDLLHKATAFDPLALRNHFAAVRAAADMATRARLIIGGASLLIVMALSFWLSRSVLRSLSDISQAFDRIGAGNFDQPIPVSSGDELGELAKRANATARNLRTLEEERDRHQWLKVGQAAVLAELRGDLEPAEVGARALRAVANHTGAAVGAIYHVGSDGSLVPLAQFAGEETSTQQATAPSFRVGEGLVGQAALGGEIMVVTDVPSHTLRVRSALCDARPTTLVLVPLVHLGKVAGVLELGLFKAFAERKRELLGSLSDTLAIAIEVAYSRSALRDLLAETQRQAEQLRAQEDELRATNEELQAQQEELREANEELTQKASELEAQRRALQQKNEELVEARVAVEQKATELSRVSAYKSQFLANMSHELRTPLNSMLLLSHLLGENESHNLTDKQVEHCRTIHGAGRDLLALINQVLDLAKIESGRIELQVDDVRVRELCERAERLYGPLARDKGLQFEVSIDPGVPEQMRTDGPRVDQVITNLLGNAIKFTERGSVKLRVMRPEPGARLRRGDTRVASCIAFRVSDTGIGIAPEDQQRVFAPFEQLDGSVDRRYGGTGLGLSIARELAQLLGGELQLESEPGRGSTFTCYLPVQVRANENKDAPAPAPVLPAASPATPRADALVPAAVPAAPQAEGNDHSPLLVIEDDPVFAGVVADIISDLGFEPVVANEGRTGLRIAREQHPCGIILDVKLADIDGFQVMQALRAEPATATIPVHFVSATDAAERGRALGAVGYLTKPATRAELVHVVAALVPRTAGRVCKVLLVEPNTSAARSLLHDLAPDNFQLHSAENARDALAMLEREHFDCMVLDLALPDMDGLDFLRTLTERSSDTPPVLVYTARALSKTEAQRLDAYAEAVVLKEGPSAERLLDEIRLFAERFRRGLPPRRNVMQALRSAGLRLEGRKVLVVDDDMRTVYALSALLRAKGAEVFVAENGRVALDALEQHPDTEMVLMDVMMPEMDGYEAMRRIRGDGRFGVLPIVALTAKAMKGDREKCIEAGASDYLPKPIDPERLFGVIHEQLGGVQHGA